MDRQVPQVVEWLRDLRPDRHYDDRFDAAWETWAAGFGAADWTLAALAWLERTPPRPRCERPEALYDHLVNYERLNRETYP